jgi:ABC-2 type transport system ATP-binding protein
LWPYISIEEHFKIISLIKGWHNYQRDFVLIKEVLDLDQASKYPAILSGGNKRKLCSGLNMLTRPQLAFFDEPTVGLDPVARRSLLDFIKSTSQSVVFTTHRLDEAEHLCDKIAILKKGKTIFDGDIS